MGSCSDASWRRGAAAGSRRSWRSLFSGPFPLPPPPPPRAPLSQRRPGPRSSQCRHLFGYGCPIALGCHPRCQRAISQLPLPPACPVHPLWGSVMGWRKPQVTRPTDSPSGLSVGLPCPAAGAQSTGHTQPPPPPWTLDSTCLAHGGLQHVPRPKPNATCDSLPFTPQQSQWQPNGWRTVREVPIGPCPSNRTCTRIAHAGHCGGPQSSFALVDGDPLQLEPNATVCSAPCSPLFHAEDRAHALSTPLTIPWLAGSTRHATGMWQGNWFSVAIGPVSKATR